MEFQGTWFPAKGLIRVYLHTRLSPTINVNKTEMWDLQTDFARIREIKERKSSKKSALSTWPFIYKYPQMQTPLVMRNEYVLKMTLVLRYTGLISRWNSKGTYMFSYL